MSTVPIFGVFGEAHSVRVGETERFVIAKEIESADKSALPREEELFHFDLSNIFGDGVILRDHLLAFSDPRKEQILIHVAKGLLTALSTMHIKQIYHLNIRPVDIVLTMDGEPQITDFSHAKRLPSGQVQIDLESSKDLSPFEMHELNFISERYSPERIAFERQIYNRQQPNPIAADKVDAWALGVSLLEIATGQYPFDRISFVERIRHWDNAYFQAKLSAIPLLKNPAPGSFMSIVKSLLDIDPQKRLSSEEDLSRLADRTPFSSLEEQRAAFADLKQRQHTPDRITPVKV